MQEFSHCVNGLGEVWISFSALQPEQKRLRLFYIPGFLIRCWGGGRNIFNVKNKIKVELFLFSTSVWSKPIIWQMRILRPRRRPVFYQGPIFYQTGFQSLTSHLQNTEEEDFRILETCCVTISYSTFATVSMVVGIFQSDNNSKF